MAPPPLPWAASAPCLRTGSRAAPSARWPWPPALALAELYLKDDDGFLLLDDLHRHGPARRTAAAGALAAFAQERQVLLLTCHPGHAGSWWRQGVCDGRVASWTLFGLGLRPQWVVHSFTLASSHLRAVGGHFLPTAGRG